MHLLSFVVSERLRWCQAHGYEKERMPMSLRDSMKSHVFHFHFVLPFDILIMGRLQDKTNTISKRLCVEKA